MWGKTETSWQDFKQTFQKSILYNLIQFLREWGGGTSGILASKQDWHHSKQVPISVVLLPSVSQKVWTPSFPSSYGLNSTITVLQGWICHKIVHEGWYAIKQGKLTFWSGALCHKFNVWNAFLSIK